MAKPSKWDAGISIQNREEFQCSICLVLCAPFKGVVLMQCNHRFCKDCLVTHVINKKYMPKIVCPYADQRYSCQEALQHFELKLLLNPNDYKEIRERSMKPIFSCRNTKCSGIIYDVGYVETFTCNVCKAVNCVKCNAIHPHLSCMQYTMAKNRDVRAMDENFIKLIVNEDVKKCPNCLIYIQRISGCDNMKCTYCHQPFNWKCAIRPSL